MLKSLLTEYGISWVFNRSLYSAKLKILRILPILEYLFEKEVNIRRVDIFDVDVNRIECFLREISDVDKRKLLRLQIEL